MSETWKQWEGRTVDGRFPLHSYLGGSDHSVVFLTQTGANDSSKAAIKLIPADGADADKRLLQWRAVRDLNHPNLVRVFDSGLDGTALLYVVEEYAEEDLSQILPERALTQEEVRAMLPPILRALQYVHEQGFVHGRVQPSNILAVGDQVKLSSDALRRGGEKSRAERAEGAYDPPEAATGAASAPAADVWQLGLILVEVLTQRLPVWDRAQPRPPEVPAAVPQPFREIAEHCLQVDPGKRWTIAQILARLEEAPVESSLPTPSAVAPVNMASAPAASRDWGASAKWLYALGVAAAVLVIGLALIGRSKPSGVSPQENSPSAQAPPRQEAKLSPSAAGDANPDTPGTAAVNTDHQAGVVRRVVPEVSPGARRTIHGTIVVRVKVNVDAAGDVAKARIESGRQSRYFSRVALDAARDWKFDPARTGEQAGPRTWNLHFAFSRAATEVSAAPANR